MTAGTIAIGVLGMLGCRTGAYYSAMDKVGYERREILADRLQDARASQLEAKEQLGRALSSLRRIDTVPVSGLEDLHADLKHQAGDTKDALNDLRSNIASVDSVARSMFSQWGDDLARINDDTVRRQSAAKMRETQQDYNQLSASLRDTEHRLANVVPALQDQVIVLETSLRAGIRPGKTATLQEVRDQVSSLIEDLQGSIDRTQHFIDARAGRASA